MKSSQETGTGRTRDGTSNTTPTPTRASFVVAIGASAGGLAALEAFFDHMPTDSSLSFVVIQHLSPDFKSLMDDLLARHTAMAIHRVANATDLEPNAIYLIPPKSHMTVSGRRLFLTDREVGRQPELPIDLFFSSLAKDVGPQAIAVILSGTGSDGSRGIQDIQQAGGLVLVQSFESAEFDGMPRSAVATGRCDALAPPESLPGIILGFAETHAAGNGRRFWQRPGSRTNRAGSSRFSPSCAPGSLSTSANTNRPPSPGASNVACNSASWTTSRIMWPCWSRSRRNWTLFITTC